MSLVLPRPQVVFLWFALLLGPIFIFLTPPFTTPDEDKHLLRIIGIAEGNIFSPGLYPKSYKAFFDAADTPSPYLSDKETVDYGRRVFPQLAETMRTANEPDDTAIYNPAVVYSPFVYWPALLPVALLLQFYLSPIAMLYVARITLFLSSVLFIYWAIRLSPVLKWQIALIGIFPTTTFLRSSVSADSLTLIYCMLFVALLAGYCSQSASINVKKIALLSFVGCLIAVSKSLYFPITWLFLALPKKSFASLRLYIFGLISVILIPFIIGTIWMIIAKYASTSMFEPVGTFDLNPKISINGQLNYIFTHVPDFLNTLYRSFILNIFARILDMVYLITNTRSTLVELYSYLLFILVFIIPDNRQTYKSLHSPLSRIVAFLAFVSMVLAIMVFCYLASNPVGSAELQAMQGRYFLPAIMSALFISKPHFAVRKRDGYQLPPAKLGG